MRPLYLISFPFLDDFVKYSNQGDVVYDDLTKAHSVYEQGVDVTYKTFQSLGLSVERVIFDRCLFFEWSKLNSITPNAESVPFWACNLDKVKSISAR